MLTTFAIWLVSVLVGSAVLATVGYQLPGLGSPVVVGRPNWPAQGWRQGLGPYGNPSNPPRSILWIMRTRVTVAPFSCGSASCDQPLGDREEWGTGPRLTSASCSWAGPSSLEPV